MSERVPAPLRAGPLVSDWFRVDSNGMLTAMTGRVELGQGNQTALLQMVADELGVGPCDIAIEAARTDRTVNEGFTAGSVSVSEGGMALRWAASALRHLLLDLAAAKLGAIGDALDIESQAIMWDGNPTDLRISQLAQELDLGVPVKDLAAPRPPKERWRGFRDIGRIDLRDRIIGAPFVHDMDRPGMLFGSPLHPPSDSARLVSLDMEALRVRPGVVDVIRDGSFVGILATSPYDAARAAKVAQAAAEWVGNGKVIQQCDGDDLSVRGRGGSRVRGWDGGSQRRTAF